MDNEILPQYSFDYQKAKPNRFASRMEAQRTVVLNEDVIKVFTTSEAINKVLRTLRNQCFNHQLIRSLAIANDHNFRPFKWHVLIVSVIIYKKSAK